MEKQIWRMNISGQCRLSGFFHTQVANSDKIHILMWYKDWAPSSSLIHLLPLFDTWESAVYSSQAYSLPAWFILEGSTSILGSIH